jgi:hypothetical protein
VYKLEGRKELIFIAQILQMKQPTISAIGAGKPEEREGRKMLRATNWADHFWVSATTTTNLH